MEHDAPRFGDVTTKASQQNRDVLHARLEGIIRCVLPTLNNGVLQDDISVRSFIDLTRPLMQEVVDHYCPSPVPDRWEARQAIQLTAFFVSSAERHLQADGNPPGTAMRLYPGVDQLLSELGSAAAHPPKDSYFTYWVSNQPPDSLTFLGDRRERFFGHAVNKKDKLDRESLDGLRAIAHGSIPFSSPASREALLLAATNTKRIHHLFLSFWKKGPDGKQPIDEEFFALKMRTFLPQYPIGGRMWPGVNAAHVPSAISMDFVTGTTNDTYHAYVADLLPFLVAEDRDRLASDIGSPSVLTRVIEALGMTRAMVAYATAEEMKDRVAGLPIETLDSLRAYKALCKAAAGQTSAHWALIMRFLVAVLAKAGVEAEGLPVALESGTGGRTHEETAAIRDMRKEHPLVTKILRPVGDEF